MSQAIRSMVEVHRTIRRVVEVHDLFAQITDVCLIEEPEAEEELRHAAALRLARRAAGGRPRNTLLVSSERKPIADPGAVAVFSALAICGEPVTVGRGGKQQEIRFEDLSYWAWFRWLLWEIARELRYDDERVQSQEIVLLADAAHAPMPNPLEDLIAAEAVAEQSRLHEAVLDLASPLDLALLDSVASGETISQAASRLKIPPGTARVRLHRLKKKIQKIV